MRRSKDIGGGVRFGGIPPGCEANRRLQPLTAKHDFDGENRSFQFAFRGGHFTAAESRRRSRNAYPVALASPHSLRLSNIERLATRNLQRLDLAYDHQITKRAEETETARDD